MKPIRISFSALVLFAAISGASAQEQRVSKSGDSEVSLKLEIERAIERGTAWLVKQQDATKGSWSDATHPAFTALSVMALIGDPNRKPDAPLPEAAQKGYAYILSTQQVDGGLYTKGLATYNTALSLTALSLSGDKAHLPAIAKARRLLVNQQQDFDKRGAADNLLDGGIGYGGTYAHSDLSNTTLALEALYYSKKVLADTEFDETKEFDLDWNAAIEFVARCQNSEATVARLGASVGLRAEDKGGFIYFPGDTKSEEIDLGNGRVALRSYGSMSYAGMLSFIYAEMKETDPRMVAVREWLSKNYTLEENPGMQAQGLFYYYHTMAKALATSRAGKLALADGKSVDWRKDLALKILSQQQPEGPWVNKGSNRWMEDNPVLVTAYALLALEHVYRTL